MSDFEDDLDGELPSVSLSQSAGEKSELEMPSATEVASQRAREDAAEQALKDLRESYVTSGVVSLSRSCSQGSSEEAEAALTEAVSALHVTDAHSGVRDYRAERLQLLLAMREHLPDDIAFLDAYIHVLKDRPEAVDTITEKLLQGISSAITSGHNMSVSGACAWLLCVSLSAPRAMRARRALRALLDESATEHVVHALTQAMRAAANGDAGVLVAAQDAARSGAGRAGDALAHALLAHALHAALEKPADADPPPPLSAESVSAIRSSWRRLPARAQLLLLRCAGRALAQETAGNTMETEEKENTPEMERIQPELAAGDAGANVEGGAALLAALAQPLPRASTFHLERQQVLTNVSKLQLLFRARFNPECENEPENLDYTEFDTPAKSTPVKLEQTTLDATVKEIPKIVMGTPVKKEKQMKMDSFVKQSPKQALFKQEGMKQEGTKQEGVKQEGVKQEGMKQDGMKEVKSKEDDEERSPERKRVRRERRAVVKIAFKGTSKYK